MNRGWSDARVVGIEALHTESPAGPPLVIAAVSSELTTGHATDMSALSGAAANFDAGDRPPSPRRRVRMVTPNQPDHRRPSTPAVVPADQFAATSNQPQRTSPAIPNAGSNLDALTGERRRIRPPQL